MIYAIEAVGTSFIKFGRAASVGKRLKELDTGCPHELHILAVADWPDGMESAVHRYLQASLEKLEWFRDGPEAQTVLECMKDQAAGLARLQYICLVAMRLEKPLVAPVKVAKPRRIKPQPRGAIPQLLSDQDRRILKRQEQRMRWWRAHGKQLADGAT